MASSTSSYPPQKHDQGIARWCVPTRKSCLYQYAMKSGLGLFPGWPVGAGLLLLRGSVAGGLLVLATSPVYAPSCPQVLVISAAVGISLGVATRVLASIGAMCAVISLVGNGTELIPAGFCLANSLSLAFTGPGAFSIDARLFGYRTVVLPERDDTNV